MGRRSAGAVSTIPKNSEKIFIEKEERKKITFCRVELCSVNFKQHYK